MDTSAPVGNSPTADEGDARSTELTKALQAMLTAMRRVRGRESSTDGLSFAQWRLLFLLTQEDELSAAELARAAEVTPPTVTVMLDQLVSAGIVERARSETDRRVINNRFTPEGRVAWEAKERELTEKWNRALVGLSDEEISAAARVLGRLREYFETM